MERKYYYSKRDQAREMKNQYMSIIIDGMDQMKSSLPHFIGRRSNDLDVANLLSTHIQGVINHGLNKFTKYVDINEYAHDSNMVINTILKELYETSLQMGNKLPPTIYIQADNCFRENKNKFVLGFCELLVWKNIFREVHLSFLCVGHTHEDIDAGFSKIADQLRRNEAGTIPRLLSLFGNMKQLKGLYNIKQWLTPCLNSISRHTKPHHFRFYRDGNNKIISEYKGNQNSIWKQLPNTILKYQPSGIPKILKPQNFHKFDLAALEKNIDRAKFLFTEQSEFNWWKRFINYLKDLKSDPDLQLLYAKEQARWILPLLPRQNVNTQEPETSSGIDPDLQEMVDKELDEITIDMPHQNTRRQEQVGRGGRGRGQLTKGRGSKQSLTRKARKEHDAEQNFTDHTSRKSKRRHFVLTKRQVFQSFVFHYEFVDKNKHIYLISIINLLHAICTLYLFYIIMCCFFMYFSFKLFVNLWKLLIQKHIYSEACKHTTIWYCYVSEMYDETFLPPCKHCCVCIEFYTEV